MPILIHDLGHDNQISIDPETLAQSDGTLLVRGSGNRVHLEAGVSLRQGSITLGDDCSLTIGADCRLCAIEIMGVRDAHVVIGPRSVFAWSTRIYLHEPGRIEIGADCMIASDTMLTVSDMHSIIDVESGLRINPAADITLGDRVWLAYEATVLKGSHIGSGCIIGYRSVFSGILPPNSLAAGVPARLLKSDVTWDVRLL